MSISNCGAVESYTALAEPTCFNGEGCDACREKFKNPPSYSLPWLKRYRKNQFVIMSALANADSEDNALTTKRLQLKEHLDTVRVLSKEVHDLCPHLLENQKYSEWTNEDTYGCSRGLIHEQIQCNGCGEVLWRGTNQ